METTEQEVRHSDSAHARLIRALIKAQSEMSDPLKTAYNPGFKSKFADLGAHLEAVRKPLRDNGLTVVQTMGTHNEKHVLLTTLYHVDGGALESCMSLELSQNTMQGLGSALTYSRRYAIAAMFALYGDVDDDGNTASEKDKGATPAQAAQSPQEALFTQAKTRIREAKSDAEKQKVLALCKSLPPTQRQELAALAGIKEG